MDEIGSFLVGFMLGFLVGAWMLGIYIAVSGNNSAMAKTAITECEIELPRNQHCVLTAIPEEMK